MSSLVDMPRVRLLWIPFSLLVTYYLVIVPIYRRYFHPLAKYPGPVLASITGWDRFFQTLGGDRHLRELAEHEKYGPIVRVAPNALSINTTSALKEIYINRKAPIQKAEFYRTIDAPSGAFSIHSEIDRTHHAFRRRQLDYAFSPSALKDAEPFVLENIRKWCKFIGPEKGQEWSEPRNMSQWSTNLKYDIMGDLAFGKAFNCIEKEDNRYIPRIIMDAGPALYGVCYLPLAWLIRPFLASPLLTYFGEMGRLARQYIQYANSQIDERLALEESLKSTPAKKPNANRKDILHHILSAPPDPSTGKMLTRSELDADSSLLISAGGDTTSTTLAAVFFYLLTNPSVLTHLTSEIRSAFPTISSIKSGPKLSSLTYLRAVIDETLRLTPPVPSHLPREITGPSGLTIDSHFLPPGTEVGTSAYCIHQNPIYYPSPYTFIPERWLPISHESTDPSNHHHNLLLRSPTTISKAHSAFCPFSLGPRGCIGKSLAYLELSLEISYTLYSFDIRPPQRGEMMDPAYMKFVEKATPKGMNRRRRDEYPVLDYFLVARDGPFVELKRRVG